MSEHHQRRVDMYKEMAEEERQKSKVLQAKLDRIKEMAEDKQITYTAKDVIGVIDGKGEGQRGV
jgi:hypothetical protein